ncbi:uncharacterized protein BXZ73DRAFT_105767 [Epithele typhae]|uniref:uncharacterized protein n=1 Tax=Epithele typhae TaxID=378194 RepID=UPI002007CF9F|nr:uncharacterized protein BXZ73DRAFT_105767 [Epithele typhae]KAH9916573.1 hypothetical protein BXZ73DRAFT_105767 [Epithele typhae]
MEASKPAAKYALSSFYSSRPQPSSDSANANASADDRKRKITDKNLPNGIAQEPEFAAESQMYRDLLGMERRLDWTMTRKRVEVHDALQRIVPPEEPQLPTRAKDKNVPRKFSTLIKHMIVELDRDQTLYPDGNIVEVLGTGNEPTGIGWVTIRRKGDMPVKMRIVIHLEQQPSNIKSTRSCCHHWRQEESRTGVIQALWNYIKTQNLQDKLDRRMVRADARLRQIFNADSAYFQHLPEHVNRFLLPPDPIILHYTLNPRSPCR